MILQICLVEVARLRKLRKIMIFLEIWTYDVIFYSVSNIFILFLFFIVGKMMNESHYNKHEYKYRYDKIILQVEN